MKAQRRKKKRPAPGMRRQLPEEFICIAPDEAKHVVSWLRGAAHGDDEEIAQLHYHLCQRCQEAAEQLIRKAVSSSKEYLHLGSSASQPATRLNGSPLMMGHDTRENSETQAIASAAKPFSMKAGGEG